MKNKAANKISSELIAAFLDGKATAQESREIFDSLSKDAGLRELLRISQEVDEELSLEESACEFIPMAAMAATGNEANNCCLECEKFILERLGIEYNENQLLSEGLRQGWQKKEGTALCNVGRHLEAKGLMVTRRYKATPDELAAALEAGESVMVAVDGGELFGNPVEELLEDRVIGQIPDHIVVVLAYDAAKSTVRIFDPYSPKPYDDYPVAQFLDAWKDSQNYLVTINTKNMKEYIAKPIDLSDVELTEDLHDLREAIAENAHEIWAENRQKEGWTYGPERNDALKQTPDMVPYAQLPEGEKHYDREMAMKTIKLLKKLGYDLIKREDTELYRVLKQRMQDAEQEFHCRRCGNVIYKHQVFCDHCGLQLDMDWCEK